MIVRDSMVGQHKSSETKSIIKKNMITINQEIQKTIIETPNNHTKEVKDLILNMKRLVHHLETKTSL